MKRSFINLKIREGIQFCREQNFHLPKWAYWSADDWKSAGHEADEIRNCKLGWDITDHGSGDYEKVGLLLMTIRNGKPGGAKGAMAKDYCEKLMLVGAGQVAPWHFHWTKMEDIINRSGGRLVIELYNCDRKNEQLDMNSEIRVSIDGIEHIVEPGGKVVLEPGQSITLPPYLYHTFYGEKDHGMVLAGEVSRVNDDVNDNRFLKARSRFPSIEEDSPAQFLLCTEYPPAAS